MQLNLKSNSVAIREVRLGSVTAYHGDFKDLVDSASCGSLRNKERCFSQSSLCLNMCAIAGAQSIRDVAIINHASVGCCSGFGAGQIISRQVSGRLGLEYNSVVIGTALDEADTVFGATDSIKGIAQDVVRNYQPKALFISTSCVSGVIGEDIDSVVEELKEEFDIPVIAMHCEGFKSKVWQSGNDILDHALVQNIVKPPKEKKPIINFKNFFESHRPQITEIFARLGVTPRFLYLNSSIADIENLAEAQATVSICGTLGTYLGNALEEMYGVPYIRSLNPSGIAGFEDWLRTIGATIGKEAEVEEYLDEERAKYLPQIEEVKKELEGKTAVLAMGPGYAYEVSRVLQELGIRILWTTAFHLDHHYDGAEAPAALTHLRQTTPYNFGTSVGDQQNFEILNILNRYKPDLYFSRHGGTTVWAVKQGIASVFVADEYMIFGYKNTLAFAKTILDTIRNRSFEKNLAARVKLPYSDWWYEQQSGAMLVSDEDEQDGGQAPGQEQGQDWWVPQALSA
jgi:nitrogenase molybdenum-iron protein alpha chain